MQIQMQGFLAESKTILIFLKWIKFLKLALIYFCLKRAFWSFSTHFPSQADHLLTTLDVKTQKLLQTGSQGANGSVKSLKDGYGNNNHSNGNGIQSTINYDFMDSQNSRMGSSKTSG